MGATNSVAPFLFFKNKWHKPIRILIYIYYRRNAKKGNTMAVLIGCICTLTTTLITIIIAVGKPLIENTKSMTKLTSAVEQLTLQFGRFETNNHEAHKRIHDRIDKEENELKDHESRIIRLEGLNK